jgi:hypothetical protein
MFGLTFGKRLLMVIQQIGYFNQLSYEAKYSAVAQAVFNFKVVIIK